MPSSNSRIMNWALVAALMTALLTPLPALAQSQSADAIVEALLPKNTGPLVRSMKPTSTRGIKIDGKLPPELDLPSIDLTVNFEFDSHRLTHDGMLILQALGKALADDRLKGMIFQIAGHTDARGGEQYNQGLSDRRALTVVEHLNTFYGISLDRLKPVGYGLTRLVDPSNPESGLNRRVEIINLQPLSS